MHKVLCVRQLKYVKRKKVTDVVILQFLIKGFPGNIAPYPLTQRKELHSII